jgi:hypothetical protein
MYGGHKDNSVCDTLAHGPMDRILLQLVSSWAALKLPVRSIQLDDWWYIGSEPESHDHMCVKEFAPEPALFPRGLPVLPSQMSYHLYGPFFCQVHSLYTHCTLTVHSLYTHCTLTMHPSSSTGQCVPSQLLLRKLYFRR